MPGQAPAITDERELLLAYINQQRDGIRNAAYGLSDEQARTTPVATSTLTIGGLIKHVAAVEKHWLDLACQRPHDPQADEEEYGENFRVAAGETLADLLAAYDKVAAETEAVARSLDLDAPVPVPKGVPWFPDDVEAWSVRWVLVHVIEETARHAGHADILREAIDGATMFELMAGVEGWPATEWLTPWKPAE
jgi:uncharacterized damage-inducible protein DinB